MDRLFNKKNFIILSAFTFVVLFFYFTTLSSHTSETIVLTKSDQTTEQTTFIPEKKTLLVFGDVMLDRYVRKYINTSGTDALFEHIQDDIDTANATMFNLEGPITKFASVVSKENLQFTFATHTAFDLSEIGIDIVSLANNHTHNFGREGLQQTRRYLSDVNLTYFGDPYNDTEHTVTRYSLGATTISLVGYHQFENPDLTKILEIIKTEKTIGNFVIFFPHWGNEYEKNASTNQKIKAKDVIDAGVDIVIGAHPHIIQNAEVYKGKPVFYSLGNFIFDQWFSEDVKYGLGLLLTFSENTLESIELKPFYRERYHPKWLPEEKRVAWCKSYIQGTLFKSDQNNPCLLTLQ